MRGSTNRSSRDCRWDARCWFTTGESPIIFQQNKVLSLALVSADGLVATTSVDYFSFPRPVDLKSRSRPETTLQRRVFFTGSNNALQEARTCFVFMRLTSLRGEVARKRWSRRVGMHSTRRSILPDWRSRICRKYSLDSLQIEFETIRARC